MRFLRIALVLACAASIFATDAMARKPARTGDSLPFPPEMGPMPEDMPPHGMGGGRYGMMAPVSEEEEARAMEFLNRVAPDIAARMMQRKETAPRWYNMAIRRTLAAEVRLSSVANSDSSSYHRYRDMFRLEARTEDLSMQYRQAETDAERAQIRSQLMDTLSRFFDMREAEKAREVERLERRLEFLKRMVEERAAHKDEIVEKRANEMLGDSGMMDW